MNVVLFLTKLSNQTDFQAHCLKAIGAAALQERTQTCGSSPAWVTEKLVGGEGRCVHRVQKGVGTSPEGSPGQRWALRNFYSSPGEILSQETAGVK